MNKIKRAIIKFTVVSTVALGAVGYYTIFDPSAAVEANVQKSEKTSYVYDTFKITNVNKKGEIRGKLISTTAKAEIQTGEGIYLESWSKEPYSVDLKKLKKGDIIKVKYYEKDYAKSIWDNIVDVIKVDKKK